MAAKHIYDEYDCFLFPTFSENYGHVIVESLFSGCPVVISKGTTPFDDCHEKAGFTVRLDSQRDFTRYLEKIADMDELQYAKLCESIDDYVAEKFQIDKLRQDYLKMIATISGERDEGSISNNCADSI